MSDLISKEVVIDTLNAVRDLVWEVDIPSPTVPEYIEHHKQMQSIMRNIDILTDKIIKLPSAQPEYTIEMQESDIDEAMKLVRDARVTTRVTILPSAQPEQRWIPCSERLPDTDDHVLCTTITKKGVRNIVRGYYFHDDSYPGGGQWSAGMNSNVIAWMPLPEPYQGGQ